MSADTRGAGNQSAAGSGSRPVGSLAIVLHSHMPYVEGYGTYPFGEEWLFDALLRSYLPLSNAVRDLTLTVTPVLADQLELPALVERARRFVADQRLPWARADLAGVDPHLRDTARWFVGWTERQRDLLESTGGDVLGALRSVTERNVALMASAATHALLPRLASREAVAMQIDAGLRSHRRRFGEPAGLWLPECAWSPGLDGLLADHGVQFTCLDQSAHEADGDALVPLRLPSGPVGFTIDWRTIERVWAWGGYPAHDAYNDFHHESLRGLRLWANDGSPYDPERAAAQARADAAEFCAGVAERLAAHRDARGAGGLCTFAIDTELLGHWWFEGPAWLAAVLECAPEHGIELLTLPEAMERHPATERPCHTASWGENKDFSTWDSPPVGDMVWAARRLELRVVRALAGGGLAPGAAERAARELMALQASDWAFLDKRRQAGDYPYHRTTDHAEALLEVIHSREPVEPTVRNLAPDLSLAPVLCP